MSHLLEWTTPLKSSPDAPPHVTALEESRRLTCSCLGFEHKKRGKPRTCKHVAKAIKDYGFETREDEDAYLVVTNAGQPGEKVQPKAPSTPPVEFPAPMLACDVPEEMHARLTGTAFDEEFATNYVMEPLLTGVRMMVRVQAGCVTCSGKSPEHLSQLEDCVLDGVVTLEDEELVYTVIDLLEYQCQSVQEFSFATRRMVLLGMAVRLVEQWQPSWSHVERLFAEGLGGVVVKDIHHVYQPGQRSLNWLTFRNGGLEAFTLVKLRASQGHGVLALMHHAASGMHVFVKPEGEGSIASLVGRTVMCAHDGRIPNGTWKNLRWDHVVPE